MVDGKSQDRMNTRNAEVLNIELNELKNSEL